MLHVSSISSYKAAISSLHVRYLKNTSMSAQTQPLNPQLLLLLQIDNLCNRLLPSGPSLQAMLVVWTVGAAVAGMADAICSSVIYVQAASMGPAYTHVSVHHAIVGTALGWIA
jgi:hypothetical protein